MKVLVVCEPGEGGVKRHVFTLIRGLVERHNCEVVFAYSTSRTDRSFGEDLELLRQNGVKCLLISIPSTIHVFADTRAVLVIAGMIVSERPDIIHLHSSKAGFVGRLACLITGCTNICLYSPHGMACHKSYLYWGFEIAAALWCYGILGVSDSERNNIEQLLQVVRPRTEVAHLCPYEPEVYDRILKVGYSKAMSYKVVTCGRMCSDKDPVKFFKVAEAICERRTDIEFVWIGCFWDDLAGRKARRLFETTKFPNRIRVTGWLESPLVEMAHADLFCMFSLGESFCYAVADAIALEIPILVRNVMGLKDLADNGRAGAVTSGEDDDIIRLIVESMSHRDAWRARARYARKWLFNTYSHQNSILEVYQVYQFMREHATKDMAVTI